ncbi:MAG: response regulator [Selenomonadaceae bacterium]|nr:response regulator [Selenomonadaceae bacterium]
MELNQIYSNAFCMAAVSILIHKQLTVFNETVLQKTFTQILTIQLAYFATCATSFFVPQNNFVENVGWGILAACAFKIFLFLKSYLKEFPERQMLMILPFPLLFLICVILKVPIFLGLTLADIFIFVNYTEKVTGKKFSALEKEKLAAEEKSRAKTAFLSSMSHDIRTPMNAIIGFTDLAMKDVTDVEKVSDYLAKIKASSSHLLSLINDVLEMSRIESGKIELDESLCSLPKILHDLNTIIIGQAEAKQQELFMDAVGVTNENIICDKLRLNQILLNLLSNAIKYTQAGGKIFVKISQREGAPAGYGNYEIRVKDNGMGMTPEFAATIFEAFTRERNSTVSGIQGTGLGMAITKRIVDLMHGTISVVTAPGEGTEFIVTANFKIAQDDDKDFSIEELKDLSALIVDDDFDACDGVAKMLSSFGLKPSWTLSGKEAVLRAKHSGEMGEKFGLYVIDWKLPDLGGIEVVRQIRKIVGDKPTVILMTAYDWVSVKDEALEAGVNAFCNKPVFRSELHQTLLNAVGRQLQTEKRHEDISDLAGKKILLVDDIDVNREIATAILEMSGFEVETAVNGQDAVETLKNKGYGYFDVILMDVQMPVMNGYEATAAIRNLPDKKLAATPILAMTANAFDEDRKAAFEAGMNGHIAKPIDVPKLMEELKKVLRN